VKKDSFVQILPFPYRASLTNALLQTVNQAKQPDGSFQLVVDYLELQLEQEPQLIEQDGRPVEMLKGIYRPRRLCFHDVHKLLFVGSIAELDILRPDHGVRTMNDVLHWQLDGERHYVFFHNSPDPAELHFMAAGCEIIEREGVEAAVQFTREWAIAPPLLPCCFPVPGSVVLPFGGDPIPIQINGRTCPDRLIVGGLSYQGEIRPDVDAVLNLGEEPSNWVIGKVSHPADRWAEQGEGEVGMSLTQLKAEAAWVIERLQKGQRVLVHCVAGFNRSVTVCCAVLMMLEGITAESALDRIRQYHPWCRPDSHYWLLLRWLASNHH
jgi:hypothetical protein